MLDNDRVEDLSTVRSHTDELVAEAFKADSPVLLEAPPGSGKSTATRNLAATSETPVTYLCGRTDLYAETKQHFQDMTEEVDYEVIPSPHRHCPSFRVDEPGNQRRLRKLYNKGYSGARLHYLPKEEAYTPCEKEGEGGCEYLRKYERIDSAIEDIDVLIGHHSHANRDKYTAGRLVVLDEFNADAFFTQFPNPNSDLIDDPGEIIPAFLDVISDEDPDFPSKHFADLTDLLIHRNKPEAREAGLEWFENHGASRSKAEYRKYVDVNLFKYNRSHLLAPLLTFSLLCMTRLGDGIEMAPHPEADIYDAWKAADLNLNTRVVRNRNTNEMFVLRPPELENAHQVIGLDGTPTLELWNLLLPYGTEFDHRQVVGKDDFTTYLKQAMNMSLMQIGNHMYHYAGGRVSDKDGARFKIINTIENGRFPLISSKQALHEYEKNGLLSKYVTRTGENEDSDETNFEFADYKASNFASVKSSNAFEKDDLGVVAGTPYPGDDVVKLWAGMCGKGVEPEDDGKTKSFGEFGDRIYEHFTHNQVVQAVLRFGRDDSVHENHGATVYITTSALPEWFDTTGEIDISSAEKRLNIIENLRRISKEADREALAYTTARDIQSDLSNNGEEVSHEYIKNTLEELASTDMLRKKKNAGKNGADIYAWNTSTSVDTQSGMKIIDSDEQISVFDLDPSLT